MSVLRELFDRLRAALADLGDALYPLTRRLAPVIDTIADFIRPLFARLGEVLEPVTDNLRDFLREHWQKVLVLGAGGSVVAVLLFTSIVYIVYRSDRDEIDAELVDYREWLYGRGKREKRPDIKIFGNDGKLLGEYMPERGSHMTMRACTQAVWLKRAVVSAEDRDFYEHGGVSVRGILRAITNNIRRFSLSEGGGTITQQLARNLFTDRARSFTRKLYETFAAYRVESTLTKDEILCLYLNKIYMGEGRIGAEEAAQFYFSKAPEKLTAAEAAMIVGLFPSPVAYSPLNNIELSLRKQGLVLETLERDAYLSAKEKNLELGRFFKRYELRRGLASQDAGEIGRYGASRDFRFNAAPTANEYVKSFLYDNVPEDVIRAGGLRVYTTIDPLRSRAALDAVRGKVAELRARMQRAGTKLDPAQVERIARRLNGAAVVLDANTGDIRAVVGGDTISEGGMTQRVWSMRRQPGSSIKGFLYALALDEGVLNVNSPVVDERVRFGNYSPHNWNRKFLGQIPLRRALAMSINTVAVKTLDAVGVSTFRNRMIAALELGFLDAQDRFPANLSLALGSGEVTPLELARMYAVVENGGRVVRPRLVTKIEDAQGQVIWQDYSKRDDGDIIFSEAAAAGAVKLMTGVFDPDIDGTVSYIGKQQKRNPGYLPFAIAGKTGTVQSVPETRKKFPGLAGVRDAWFVGLVPGEVAVVWFGHDEGAPFDSSGAQAAAVWASYAQAALPGRVSQSWPAVDAIEIVDPVPEDATQPPEEVVPDTSVTPTDPLLDTEAGNVPVPKIEETTTNPDSTNSEPTSPGTSEPDAASPQNPTPPASGPLNPAAAP